MENHPKLKFLGLALTNASRFDLFLPFVHESYNSKLIITSDLTLDHLMKSLKYYRLRPTYIQKTLFSLFNHTSNLEETKLDLIEVLESFFYSLNNFFNPFKTGNIGIE